MCPSGSPFPVRINGGDKKLTVAPSNQYARPSSAHSGGVNVAMCGSEVFFLREDIDYKVYTQLMTTGPPALRRAGHH